VAIVNGYITLAELKTYLGLSGSGQDDNLENAIEGASREIDAICGRPNAIKQATFIQSARLFKRKDAPFSSYGGQDTGSISLQGRIDPDAFELIKGYRKNSL
jgi:hypothetical protein